MSFETEADKDLALNADDAESVVGGAGKTGKKTKVTKVTKVAPGHSLTPIIEHFPTNPVAELDSSDCDPDDVTGS